MRTYKAVVPLGLFCMNRRVCYAAGSQRERFPFDDVASSLEVVNHCLEDDFADYLSFDQLIQAGGPKTWTVGPFVRKFRTERFWGHHDMSSQRAQDVMRDRVERFRRLDGDTLFVSIGDTPAVFNGWVDRVRANLTQMFPGSDYLVIGIGEGADHQCAGVEMLRFQPRIPVHDGFLFQDPPDNLALEALVRARIQKPDVMAA